MPPSSQQPNPLERFENALRVANAIGEELIVSIGDAALAQDRVRNLDRIIEASRSSLGNLVTLAETAKSIEDQDELTEEEYD
jgi:hypothetical protein